MNADTSAMCERILRFVDERGGYGVSFAELSLLVSGFDGGALALCHHKFKNVVFWLGMTEAASEAMRHLLSTSQLKTVPASPLVYMVDGRYLSLQHVKRAVDYKTPHWLVTTLGRPAVLDRLHKRRGVVPRSEGARTTKAAR